MHRITASLLLFAACSPTDTPKSAPDVVAAEDLAQDAAETLPPSVDDATALLNARRAASGLDEVTVDPTLSAACEAHVSYMRATGKVIHQQDMGEDAYSAVGAAAGENALIAGGATDPVAALELWFGAIYHRLPMLAPGLKTVGVAFDAGYACLDVYSDSAAVEEHVSIQYPANGAVGVSHTLEDVGPVTPFPPAVAFPTGPTASLTFGQTDVLSDGFVAALVAEADGQLLPAFVRLPNDPEDPYKTLQGNTVTVTSLAPLSPLTSYRVMMKGEVAGNFFERQWVFSTRD